MTSTKLYQEELVHRAHGQEAKHRAPPGGDQGDRKPGAIKPWIENIWPNPLQYGGEQNKEAQGSFGIVHSGGG